MNGRSGGIRTHDP